MQCHFDILTCIQLPAKTEKGSSHNHCMYYYGDWH